jgi:hypothetical protein
LVDLTFEGEQPKCEAYPDGIPVEIYGGSFDHREPFGGEAEGKLFLPDPNRSFVLDRYEAYLTLRRASDEGQG